MIIIGLTLTTIKTIPAKLQRGIFLSTCVKLGHKVFNTLGPFWRRISKNHTSFLNTKCSLNIHKQNSNLQLSRKKLQPSQLLISSRETGLEVETPFWISQCHLRNQYRWEGRITRCNSSSQSCRSRHSQWLWVSRNYCTWWAPEWMWRNFITTRRSSRTICYEIELKCPAIKFYVPLYSKNSSTGLVVGYEAWERHTTKC